tara:strand:+ start:2469 stop:2594 length:126 start_codon:yes stop_codon:yes gene_type:complete
MMSAALVVLIFLLSFKLNKVSKERNQYKNTLLMNQKERYVK